MKESSSIAEARPPVVAVVGHIDHGKSTLLDYIRQTRVVEGEAGGITQHLSAYEAVHKNAAGEHRITFLDTPGHEAFRAMRSRGLSAADVAILVVSAEEGVRPQTLEALKLIEEAQVPYIVALTKTDKPGADVERAKRTLLESGVYLEGLGGNIPYVPVSSKTGQGVPELLDLIVLAAEIEGLTADPAAPGEGLIIEAHVDAKRGNTATLIVKQGSLRAGEFVVAGEATAPVRIMENFLGKPIREALPGSPARVVGFSSLPAVGGPWRAVESKKEAERDAQQARQERHPASASDTEETSRLVVPILIKSDFAGTGDAVLHELEKLPPAEGLEARVIGRGVGPVSEGDVRLVGGGAVPGIIAAFNVKVEREARELAERQEVAIGAFDIIYRLSEWLAGILEERRPRQEVEEKLGEAKVLKVFSTDRGRVVLGGRVEEGVLSPGTAVRLLRRDVELGRGELVSLQSQKKEARQVEAGAEFGAMLKTSAQPAPGDRLEAIRVVLR